jgi:hypothetical protein
VRRNVSVWNCSRDVDGSQRVIAADRVIAATGYRPDHTIAGERRLDLDPILGSTRVLAPLIDPNLHSCGAVRPHGVDELTHPLRRPETGRRPATCDSTGPKPVSARPPSGPAGPSWSPLPVQSGGCCR